MCILSQGFWKMPNIYAYRKHTCKMCPSSSLGHAPEALLLESMPCQVTHVLILLLDGNSPAGTGSASWSPQGSLASLPSMNVCLFLRCEMQWRSSIWPSQRSRAKSDGSEDLAPRTWRTSPWVLAAGWMTVTTALAWARAHSEWIDQTDTHRRQQTVPGRSIY